MTYEIPQELEYQEKIVFGLTFKQLLYVLLFLPFVIISLKLPLPIYLKIVLSLFPSGLALVCMFTHLPKHFLDWIRWQSLKSWGLMDTQMKSFFNLKEIKGDTVCFGRILETTPKLALFKSSSKKNLPQRKISIFKVDPINFSIRNDQEKALILHSFQKFLNSLDFPIQIVIATDSLNLDEYLNSLSEKIDPHHKELFEDYTQYLCHHINSQGLLNRQFYIVVPHKEEIGLSIQVEVLEGLLKSINLSFIRLKDEDLTQCLASFFNDLYADEEKELNQQDYIHSTIAPLQIIHNVNELRIGDRLVRVLSVRGYPRTVEGGFLDKLITLAGDFDVSIHIEPFSIQKTMVMLNKELQKQRADLWALHHKEMINPTLEIKYKDTRAVLEELQKGTEKLFNVSLYISIKGATLDDLEVLTKKVESELNALLMIPCRLPYQQHLALKSSVPFGTNELNLKRNVTTKALSAFFPFTSQFLDTDPSGICLGLNKSGIPIIKDIFTLANANGVVLASSGGGKSYFTKLMISRSLLNGTKVMVIDPQGEYVDLAHRMQGEVITISKSSGTVINPLDLMGHDLDEKKLTLLDLFPVMLGTISEIQRAVLDRALTDVYLEKGITSDPITWKKEPPMLGDLLRKLKYFSRTATKIEMETYRSLINRLEMYVTGVFSFLNKQTNLNFDNHFVVFNIGEMPNQVKPTIMFLILDYVYMRMKKDKERKILVIDEAWSLLERTEDESYIFKIVKTCRKFNLGLLLITQDVGDLLSNDAGRALLNNSEYTLLLRQKPSIIDSVEKTFRLSLKEKERLLTARLGEGVLIMSNEHSEITIFASPKEHEVITTNPDELLERERAKTKDIVTMFETNTLDFKRGYYKTSELGEDEKQQLLNQGYERHSFIGLFGGRMQEYFLKSRSNESPIHWFLVKALEEYIKKYADKVELFETSDADIVFEVDGKNVAIEVETGVKLRKENPRIEMKVNLLNQKYGHDWFIVVTDWKDKEKYQKYGQAYVRKEVPAILKKNYFSQGSNFQGTASVHAENARFEVQNVPGVKGNIITNFEPSLEATSPILNTINGG